MSFSRKIVNPEDRTPALNKPEGVTVGDVASYVAGLPKTPADLRSAFFGAGFSTDCRPEGLVLVEGTPTLVFASMMGGEHVEDIRAARVDSVLLDFRRPWSSRWAAPFSSGPRLVEFLIANYPPETRLFVGFTHPDCFSLRKTVYVQTPDTVSVQAWCSWGGTHEDGESDFTDTFETDPPVLEIYRS